MPTPRQASGIGMVAFSRYLESDDVGTIRAYVIQRAHDEQKRRADTR